MFRANRKSGLMSPARLATLLVITGMVREELLDEHAHAGLRGDACSPEAKRIAAEMAGAQ